MADDVRRYRFDSTLPFEEIEASLVLAIFAAESLHGAEQVRLDAAHAIDHQHHSCVIDGSTQVGRDINRLFTGFVLREFGPDAFCIERTGDALARQPREVHA